MGLEPATFGATIRRYLFLSVAECCTIALTKLISLLMVAHRYCVLRSEWCQKAPHGNCELLRCRLVRDASKRTISSLDSPSRSARCSR
jgi:hypothetical protein